MNRNFRVIAAIGLNTGIIGSSDSNSIPWKIPSDLAFFKNTTLYSTILMGSRTFDSLGNRNLPNRRSVVLTRSPDSLRGQPHAIYTSFEDALKYEDPNLFVIGGSHIYRECLRFNPKTIYLTIVDDSGIRPSGSLETDVCFPISGNDILYHGGSELRIENSSYSISDSDKWEFENGFLYKFVELNNTLF